MARLKCIRPEAVFQCVLLSGSTAGLLVDLLNYRLNSVDPLNICQRTTVAEHGLVNNLRISTTNLFVRFAKQIRSEILIQKF